MIENKLSNQELIKRSREWISRLCKSGGKDWMLTIPADVNGDPDILFTELCNRLESPTTADASVLKAAWNMAITVANNDCMIMSDKWNDDDDIEKADAALQCAKSIRGHLDHPHPDLAAQYSTQSPSSIEESGLKEGEEMDVLQDMYNDECCLKQILLKAVNEIIAATGENALEIAKKAKLEYEDIVQMK